MISDNKCNNHGKVQKDKPGFKTCVNVYQNKFTKLLILPRNAKAGF